jgi:hypothetical protein
LPVYFICQAKTGLSALALMRYLGVSYPTAWLIQHKLMEVMSDRETHYTLSGQVQVDDAYFGGELSGGKAGRGSENKVPFVAALAFDDEGHPLRVKLTPVSGFTSKAIANWAKTNLAAGCAVLSDGLVCFAAVTEAGCQHQAIIIGGRKPKDLPEFLWLNTVLGNLKTSLGGAYHAFDFAKYASRYLAAFAYRFNRRFQLDTLPRRLLVAAIIAVGPRPDAWLRSAEAACKSRDDLNESCSDEVCSPVTRNPEIPGRKAGLVSRGSNTKRNKVLFESPHLHFIPLEKDKKENLLGLV